MASTDAKPLPIKNSAYRITFPIFDADGDLVTGATALDSEVSLDGGTFADCTNEATEIATASGIYYLDLTAAEMNADTISVIIKTTSSGAKTTPIVLYPATGNINNLDAAMTSRAAASVCTEARLAELDAANLPTDVAAVKTDTAAILLDTGTDGVVVAAASKTGYSIAGTKTTLDALNDITAASVWAVATRVLTAGTNIALAKGTGVTGFNDIAVADIFTGQMTEAYAADGTAPTLAQMQYMIWSALSQMAISGTTITCKKLDGSTNSMTFTVDSATNPTSRTRAT